MVAFTQGQSHKTTYGRNTLPATCCHNSAAQNKTVVRLPASQMTLNADGFGVGWYNERNRAAVFRSITAAWNNRNLRELCSSIESRCVFAHVRAASEGSVISEQNCHPFRYGRLLFQHNGHIEAFGKIKRRIISTLREDLYTWIEGTTDSEAVR